MNSNFRILPLLIIVAMLTFSVRIADFVMGFSSLSGSAVAQDAPAELTGSKTIAEQMQKTAKTGDSMKVTQMPEVDVPDMEWRDASDQELDYANVRMEMFDDLSARRQMLDKREKEMMTREALLRAAEQEIDRKYQELSGLRGEIENLLEQQSPHF